MASIETEAIINSFAYPPPLLTKAQVKASQHLYRMFPNMQEKVPECRRGLVELEHTRHSHREAYVVGRTRNELRTTDPMVQMNIDRVGWMFDTLHEKWMNRTAVLNARGDVLIGGLGMGMILWPILRKRSVTSVTVLENNPDVTALILPTLDRAVGRRKLEVIEADARGWETDRRFDYIWLDCIPAYGYGLAFMEIHDEWIGHFNTLHRTGGQRGWHDVDHWGYQENLLYCLHGMEPENWPWRDRRPYPIGPPDPAIALMVADLGLHEKLGVTVEPDRNQFRMVPR